MTEHASDSASPTIPPDATFSFKAPYPSTSLKQRRISMASPNSPRVVPAWHFRDDTTVESHVAETTTLPERKRGKIRKISNQDDDDIAFDVATEKKLRKKWTKEETDMLVKGCNIHGVGNWKTILNDPTLRFDNRSPVDLKDRFRTYFPDAYKQHYPNAKTHLSSKVRAMLPDGSSLFEKTRSKKRRPFTEEEDRALKAGYEKHGTVWAAIVKDPVFQAQNRRSTDLRDRFRNAFPDLYQAAGYKPRAPAQSKKARGESKQPIRAATDDQLAMSSTSNTAPLRRRRANTNQGLLRGGTKSVPQSTHASEDEASSEEEEDIRPSSLKSSPSTGESPQSPIKADTFEPSSVIESVNMDTVPDFASSSQEVDPNTSWPSGVDTPVHSHHAWSGVAGSPTPSHPSSDLLNHSSPFRNMGMIGKSAWGTQDWFSANPRMDSSGSLSNSGASSFLDDPFSPSSPFSFNHLNHGVLDRYDLFPTSYMHADFTSASEIGLGDHNSTFSDELFPPASGFRGFTHHSNTAGDLIFGARTHQPQSQFGLGFGSFGLSDSGLGLQQNGINPMQLHTPSLPGIMEMEMASITLNDRPDTGVSSDSLDPLDTDRVVLPPPLISQTDVANKEEPMLLVNSDYPLTNIEELLDIHNTPPATPQTSRPRPLRKASASAAGQSNLCSLQGRSLSVPPSESRAAPSRPPPPHSISQPTGRQAPFYAPSFSPQIAPPHNSFMDQPQSSLSHSHSHHDLLLSSFPSPFASQSNTNAPSHNAYDLSFLDLHYYSSGTPIAHQNNVAPNLSLRIDQTQNALDLASVPTPVTAVPPQSARYHHRGASQGALLTKKSDNNKRKRASWDGGAP